MKELSAQERLQKELGPGFAKTLMRASGVQRQYEASIQTTAEIRKQRARFDDMSRDLTKAEENLKKGLGLDKDLEKSLTKSITGVEEGDQAII